MGRAPAALALPGATASRRASAAPAGQHAVSVAHSDPRRTQARRADGTRRLTARVDLSVAVGRDPDRSAFDTTETTRRTTFIGLLPTIRDARLPGAGLGDCQSAIKITYLRFIQFALLLRVFEMRES